MKRTSIRAVAMSVALAGALTFGLTACGGDGDDGSGSSSSSSSSSE